MLDQRPIPRYMLGFPPRVQHNILRTVENQLEEMAKEDIPKEVAEKITEMELDELRKLCQKDNTIGMSYQRRLSFYLSALRNSEEIYQED